MRKRDLAVATMAVLAAWQLLALLIDRPVLPQPWTVMTAFISAFPADLSKHMLISAWRVVASIMLAVAAAVPAGLGLGLSPAIDRLAAVSYTHLRAHET